MFVVKECQALSWVGERLEQTCSFHVSLATGEIRFDVFV